MAARPAIAEAVNTSRLVIFMMGTRHDCVSEMSRNAAMEMHGVNRDAEAGLHRSFDN
jgi:hypothetical protein